MSNNGNLRKTFYVRWMNWHSADAPAAALFNIKARKSHFYH